jgi:hypothetical protein
MLAGSSERDDARTPALVRADVLDIDSRHFRLLVRGVDVGDLDPEELNLLDPLNALLQPVCERAAKCPTRNDNPSRTGSATAVKTASSLHVKTPVRA